MQLARLSDVKPDLRLPKKRRALTPVARRLVVIVVVFVAIVACLLLLVHAEMAIMTGVRAYVEGESNWSKSQKNAVFHLRSYAATRNPLDWRRSRAAIAVPLGDHRARVELDRELPDLMAVRSGFHAGRNHPDDVTAMIRLYRRFRSAPYMADAIAIWAKADRYLLKLDHAARALNTRIEAGASDAALAPLLIRVAELDRRLTPIEEAFSATLGAGARALSTRLRLAIDGIALLLVVAGVVISWQVLRRVRDGEARFRRLLETASDAIVVIDVTTGRIVDANPRAGTLLGMPVAALLGVDFESLVPASEVERHRECRTRALAEGAAAASGIHVRRTDGQLVPIDVSASATMIDGRQLMQSILRDVTERERAAGAQRAATTALERSFAEVERARRQSEARASALAHQALELDAARTAALESVRVKSEFVATMSHELRTPLNVILGYVAMLSDGDGGDVSDAQRHVLGRVHESARQLLEMIDATLAIGRLDAVREVVTREPLDVGGLLAEVGAAFEPLVPAGVVLRVHETLGVRRPSLDGAKLRTIARNLVGNALKFTDTGTVEVAVDAVGSEIILEVRDTGIGLRPEELPLIFEMFRQCDGSTTRRYGGVGLGLHIVKRLVDLLGGTIDVASTFGVGTTFTVRLPLATEATAEVA